MRKNVWLSIILVMLLAGVFLAASCAKKEMVQTQPVEAIQAEAPMVSDRSAEQAEQSKRPQEDRLRTEAPMVSDRSAEQAEQARRLQEDRLRAEAAAREAARTVFVNENIHFAYDSSVLSDQAQQMLNGKADYLRTNPGVTVTVEGHCDERGTDTYNTVLGERRAESVKNFLVNNLGISANRLNTISYGEKRPIAMGHTEDSWAKNRRAQFVIN
jgi:peptidoglycan-associated lipoprotein